MLDWISQKSIRYESKGILVQAGCHAFLPISGMLTQLLGLDCNETLTFKRSNQNGRLILFIFHLLPLLLRIYIQV